VLDSNKDYFYHQGTAEALVNKEIRRQLNLQKEGKFTYIAYDKECPLIVRLAMLTEEVGEVARAIQELDESNLKEELVQIAAIAVSWVARLEAEGIE
jgi:NTP pyrophosphatase (non-canonical NTP hydrolase)